MPQADFKQLLDEVFVISRIIEVEVGVLLYIERKKIELSHVFTSSVRASSTKPANLTCYP